MTDTFYSIKFFLNTRNVEGEEKAPLCMRIIAGRKKAELFLNQLIEPKSWDERKERVIAKTLAEAHLNHQLVDIENRIHKICQELEEEGIVLNAKNIMDVYRGKKLPGKMTLLKFVDQFIAEIEAKPLEYKAPTIAHYHTTRMHLVNYFKSHGKEDMVLDKFRRADVDGFEHYLLTSIHPVLNKAMSRNSANRYLKHLKTMLKNAIRKEVIKRNPFSGIKLKTVATNKVFLDADEIRALVSHPLGDNESLKRARDIFLFSVYTGLRHSDVLSLKSENIRKDESGRLWIVTEQVKTNDPIQVPMLEPARAIYDKYEKNRLATGYVLPRRCNQAVNTSLKVIARLVGIRPITHHCARHTFATTVLLENGVDLKTVSRYLGHKSVKSTEVYAKITKHRLEEVAREIESKLSGRI
ncbi:MAG: site-specific integrase [Bacteroidetes bacterium]|nr:site-specific integrase [Bacteroidota bacterium]